MAWSLRALYEGGRWGFGWFALERQALGGAFPPEFARSWASLVAQSVKNLPAMRETWVQSLGQEDSLEKGVTVHSSILPGESHGQRSLESYSPWVAESRKFRIKRHD